MAEHGLAAALIDSGKLSNDEGTPPRNTLPRPATATDVGRISPKPHRMSAAIALLDRGWGKPLQTMEVLSHKTHEHMTDADVDARIAELRGRIAAATPQEAAQGDPSKLN